ncbi:hypothetical protein Hanom_Chr10g00874221 [Helianthus anomalus]
MVSGGSDGRKRRSSGAAFVGGYGKGTPSGEGGVPGRMGAVWKATRGAPETAGKTVEAVGASVVDSRQMMARILFVC